ncbi:MAG: hypothetical protein FJ276_15590 [Planctomycetes bacterium]|nr:hypothetical protein [Planctomycetota bacterium]
MKRRRNPLLPSFDSFLDIVTNVVGVMVLIVIATLVNAGDMQVSLGTPVLRDPPESASRLFFECRGGRVVRLDEQELDRLFRAAVQQHLGKTLDQFDFESVDELPRLFEEHDIGDACYRIKVEVRQFLTSKSLVWVYEPRPDAPGESLAEIHRKGSAYQRALAPLHPRQHFLFFTVRPDSFETFRAARRLARASGLSVGWYPRALDEPLIFSSGGGVGQRVQ